MQNALYRGNSLYVYIYMHIHTCTRKRERERERDRESEGVRGLLSGYRGYIYIYTCMERLILRLIWMDDIRIHGQAFGVPSPLPMVWSGRREVGGGHENARNLRVAISNVPTVTGMGCLEGTIFVTTVTFGV